MSQFVELEKYAKTLAELAGAVDYLERIIDASKHSQRHAVPFDRPSLLKNAEDFCAMVKGEAK